MKIFGAVREETKLAYDITYIYLSADSTLEVQIAFWKSDESNEDCWSICFQPLDENDLKYLVK